ncbi:MAG TPA: hypothetical protein VNL35_00080 [Chloroflexota bacterium]|nr:hypothetical protein [Chloroflexota bacterium]
MGVAVQLGIGGAATGAAVLAVTRRLVPAGMAPAVTRITSPSAALGTIKVCKVNRSTCPGATVASTKPRCKALNP